MLDFSSQTVDTENGWASVQNQQLIIHDPAPGGQLAQLSAGDQLSVLIDQTPLQGSIPIDTRTPISIQFPPDQAPLYESEFRLSPDRCSLELRLLVQQAGQHYVLADHPPTPHLCLTLISEPLPLTDFEQTLGLDILQSLQDSRIIKGIQPDGIRQAIQQPGHWVLVAETPRPAHAENRLDFLFELPQPEPASARGFRIRWPVLEECLAEEMILQRFFRPPGRPGYTVYGDLLKSEAVPEPPLRASDKSVEVSEFGEVFAKVAGLPIFDGEQIRVGQLQKLQALSNQEGLIHDLDDSLSVAADLSDNTRIWSKGFIEIKGSVSQSEIHSIESLIIHGSCIGTQLSSGGDSAARMRLLAPVSELKQAMEDLLLMYKDIENRVPAIKLPPSKDLFVRLIKTQFPRLMQDVERLWQLNKSLKQLHPRRTMLLKVVLSNFMNIAERPLDLRIFKDWLDKITAFLNDLRPAKQPGGDMYLDYVQKSELVAKGSIYILGEGCYNSRLQAGGDILFCGKPGYCREGALQAQGRIIAGELGSPNGSRLKIQVSQSAQIDAQYLHPGVEIFFGDAPGKHFVEAYQHVNLRWESNQICISDSSLFKSETNPEILIKKI